MSKREFTTFCHISQFGDGGYLALPRMIAMSRVCLWAPSSAIIKSEHSRVSPDAFLRYVDNGAIRVFARRKWIFDSGWRDSQKWPSARWDTKIDGEIRRICEKDAGLPKDQRRVVAAPEERGYEFADAYLAEHPAEFERWRRILLSKKLSQTIPGGSREAALREAANPDLAVRGLLRDAYNHGQAFAFSEADAPLLTRSMNQAFLRILGGASSLEETEPSFSATATQQLTAAGADLRLSVAASQLLEILALFEIAGRHEGSVDSWDPFINSSDRADLMNWMQNIRPQVKRTKPGELDGLVLERLTGDLRDGRFVNTLRELLNHKAESAAVVLAAVAAAAGFAGAPIVYAVGLGCSLYPIGMGVARQAGWTAAEFTGPQWPFRYTYGTKPKRKQWKKLLYDLDEISHGKSVGTFP
jgi:hypothetical protein